LAARLHSPFRADALQEYGEFLASQPFGRVAEENYAPLWRLPDEPAMTKAAHALFDAPRRPFEEAATWQTDSFNYQTAFRLLSSPLTKDPISQAAIGRALEDKTVIGTLQKKANGEAQLKVTAWKWSGQTVNLGDRPLENGASQSLRVCDLVGFWLREDVSPKNGPTQYRPLLDVALPTAQHDARLKQIAVLVVRRAPTVPGDCARPPFGFQIGRRRCRRVPSG